MDRKIQVYVVIRIDDGYSSRNNSVTVKEVLPTMEQAVQEVERLNGISKDARYFWQATRFFPEGRSPT